MFTKVIRFLALGVFFVAAAGLAGCAGKEELPSASILGQGPTPVYRIGPLDTVQIFVWRNPELTTSVPVRPDGRISVPLIEDLEAAGKTPSQLARDIEKKLSTYVQEPIVTVLVSGFVGTFDEQIRVVGEATRPQAIPYRANMTLLDVMIEVGGITDFAAGNDSTIVRVVDAKQKSYAAHLDDLLKDGDIGANVQMMPGDVLIIPESWF